MKDLNINIDNMTTLEKIQLILTPMQIRKIKADFESVKNEYESQNINSTSFMQVSEMVSVNTRKNLDVIQKQTWRLFGVGGMVLVSQAIMELCGKFELNMYKQ